MGFEKLYEGKTWPEVKERLGVMSVDTLNRIWLLVLEEDDYLIAIAKDGKDALLGRMGRRDDGKFCIEIVVRAPIENGRLCHPGFWHGEMTNSKQLYDVMQDHINRFQRDDN